MGTIRVGIIGAGAIFDAHARDLGNIPGIAVTALCDRDLDLARNRAAAFGIPRATADWREVAHDPEIDAVFVITPPMAHREQAVAALEAGKHVFLEKPIAHTLADGRAIADAARRARGVCQVGFNNLFEPATRDMWERACRGELGRIVRAWDRHTQYRPTTSWTNRRDAWRLDQALSGGRMQEFGSHKVNWLLAVGGPIARVFGRNATIAESLVTAGVDDTVVMLADYSRGGIGGIEISLAPTAGEMRAVGIQGTEATVVWDGGTHLLVRRKDVPETEKIAIAPVPESRQAHFFRWIRSGSGPAAPPTPEVTAEAGYRVLEVVFAFLASARDGDAKIIDV